MNDKEALKRAVNKLQQEVTKESLFCICTAVFILVAMMLVSKVVGQMATFWRVVAILVSAAGGCYIGFRVWVSTKRIEAECLNLWNKILVVFSRQETTLEEILFALEEGKAAEEIAMYVGKRKKLEVEDDLALEKLEEREAEHIPRLE